MFSMQAQTLRPIRPVAPAAAWIGGKRRLAARLVDLIETIPHTTYAEPFVGMGGVFLRRRSAASVEVINDVSGDVTTFFRILQRHHAAFLDVLRFGVTSRREFDRLTATDPSTLTDLERAARFLYLQRLAFGGKVTGRSFGVSPGASAGFDLRKLRPTLADVADRLSGVIIENLDWAEFVRRYDGPEVLFYLDPPYWGCERDYGAGLFGRGEFARLAEVLAGIRGTFALSINDRPEVREIFAGFEMEVVRLDYSIGRAGPTTAAELIITPRGQGRRQEARGLFDGP
jgi:DNA adenine methylase